MAPGLCTRTARGPCARRPLGPGIRLRCRSDGDRLRVRPLPRVGGGVGSGEADSEGVLLSAARRPASGVPMSLSGHRSPRLSLSTARPMAWPVGFVILTALLVWVGRAVIPAGKVCPDYICY